MTHTHLHAGIISPRISIDTLIARHGSWRVIRALIAALIRANRAPPLDAGRLNPHLQRDIGLLQDPPSPRHWDIRL